MAAKPSRRARERAIAELGRVAGEYRDRLRLRRSKSFHQSVHEAHRQQPRGWPARFRAGQLNNLLVFVERWGVADAGEATMEHGACGNRLGSRFGMNSAPFLTVRALRKSQLAVTEIINDNPHLKTLPIPPEDAFLVHLLTRDCLAHGLYVDNKSAAPDLFPAGVTALYDLTRDPIADMHCPTRCLSSYLPRTALQEIADDVGERRVRALEFRHGRAYDDPVMWSLGQAMLPALAKPDQVNTIFVDHIALAFRAHIARAYGGMQSTHPRVRGGGSRPLAGAPSQVHPLQQSERGRAARPGCARMRLVGKPFHARVPAVSRNGATSMAAQHPRRAREGAIAEL